MDSVFLFKQPILRLDFFPLQVSLQLDKLLSDQNTDLLTQRVETGRGVSVHRVEQKRDER